MEIMMRKVHTDLMVPYSLDYDNRKSCLGIALICYMRFSILPIFASSLFLRSWRYVNFVFENKFFRLTFPSTGAQYSWKSLFSNMGRMGRIKDFSKEDQTTGFHIQTMDNITGFGQHRGH